MSPAIRKKTSKLGRALLRDPLLNKGSAFTAEERDAFRLHGLLPYRVLDIQTQADRVYAAISHIDDDLGKYVALASLQDRNEYLYFYVLKQHLKEYLPIVYTPTIGMATKRFSHVYQRGRGAWITPAQSGRIVETLRNSAHGRDIRLIVATDNESILGIGDQGVGGIKISIGKLSLYTAAAGIDPATVLPISLDVGTQNVALREDPGYLGWPYPRLRGAEYEALVDEFVAAVKSEFPHALIQWEDFRKDNALRIMDRYRDSVLSFNDDIQGTGAVALAGILSASRIHGCRLRDERVLILGAGAAGLGINRQLRVAMRADGLEGDALKHAIAVLDSKGLIVDDGSIDEPYKLAMAWSSRHAATLSLDGADRGLERVCAAFRPTVLIGASGQNGAFSEKVVRMVADSVNRRPVILPLSNPTDQSEVYPVDAINWSRGRALVAAGSPFADVTFAGKTFRVGQANNAFIFPGIGLGAILAKASKVTDSMFYAAAKALADEVTDAELGSGLLFPSIDRLTNVSVSVARAVIHDAMENGLAEPLTDEQIEYVSEVVHKFFEQRLCDERWTPEYPLYEFLPVAGI